MVVTVDTIAQTSQVTLDLNGTVLGIGDPPPQTLNGTYTDSGTTITQSSLALGTFTVTVDAHGSITGSATNLVVVPQINRVDFAGTINATQVLVNYTITFTGGDTAVGTLTLNKI
jgi:hypothetical protein